MADKKISALTGATTPLAGTEVLPVVQGGATVKVAVSDLTAGRAVTASSINKVAITAPATASTLTIADGKTLTASNTLTLAGTDATTQTFPTTNATIARTDAAQTFTGDQTFGTGNLVQGTAAKGFNFTANTPAAGATLTSQLFNWYEEGTYLATLIPSTSGTITLQANYDVLAYTKIGRMVHVQGTLTVNATSLPIGAIKLAIPFAIANLYRVSEQPHGSIFIPGGLSLPANSYIFSGSAGDLFISIYATSGTTITATAAEQTTTLPDVYVSFWYIAA